MQNALLVISHLTWLDLLYFLRKDSCCVEGAQAILKSQVTSLRMPSKWQHQKDNAAACLCFLIYLTFLRPAADRAVSILPWVVSRGRSHGFLWADSIFCKCDEGRSNSGLFASKRSKVLSRRLLKYIGRKECKHRCPKVADPTYRRTKLSELVKMRGALFPHRKLPRGEKGKRDIWHVYRLLGPIAVPIRESSTNSREAIDNRSSNDKAVA
jgi:hypothetical protein